MPQYEYGCSQCHHRFELRQKFSDPPATECPECGGPVQKLISQAAFSLKGGGWYAEGYSEKKSSEKKSGSGSTCPSGGSCSGCPSAA